MKYLFYTFFFTALITAYGCSDNDGPGDTPSNCSTQFAQSFEDELEAVNLASTNYASDPTSANCEEFKVAYQGYLNALDGWEDCANFYNQVNQWEQAIDAAQVALDNIVC